MIFTILGIFFCIFPEFSDFYFLFKIVFKKKKNVLFFIVNINRFSAFPIWEGSCPYKPSGIINPTV